jgi:heat shock protein HtpX
MYKAKPAGEGEYRQLYTIVRDIAGQAKMPMPKVYVIPQEGANAFATGRDPKHAAVCVTEGIMGLLDSEELKGVIAHEMGHVKNRDILIMSVTATVAGAVMMLANMARWAMVFGGRSRDNRGGGNAAALLVAMIVAPLAAMLIQLAISRSREYAADRRGANLAHSSKGLANALRKLEESAKHRRLRASPQTAHMFIVNPLSGGFFAGLFSTHPPIQERIRRLEAMVV